MEEDGPTPVTLHSDQCCWSIPENPEPTLPTFEKSTSSSFSSSSSSRYPFRSGLGTRHPWKDMVQLRSLSIPANAVEAFQKIQNPRYLLSDKLHHRHSFHPLRRGIHTHSQVLHHILCITTWSNLSIILLPNNSIAFDPACTNALYCASISTANLHHYSSTLLKRPIAPPS